jgi:hypothetical protein
MPENHGSFTLPARLIRMTGGIEASHDRHKREITAGHTDTSLTHTHTHTHTHTRTRETAAENGEANDVSKRQRTTARQATSRNDSEPRRGRRPRETTANHGEAGDLAKRQRTTARQATSRNDSEPRRGKRPCETAAINGEAGDLAKRRQTTARQATLRNGGEQRRGRRLQPQPLLRILLGTSSGNGFYRQMGAQRKEFFAGTVISLLF